MIVFSEDRCVVCGAVVPEGRMVFPACELAVTERALTKQSAVRIKPSVPSTNN